VLDFTNNRRRPPHLVGALCENRDLVYLPPCFDLASCHPLILRLHGIDQMRRASSKPACQ
jgi:hypothetical protein